MSDVGEFPLRSLLPLSSYPEQYSSLTKVLAIVRAGQYSNHPPMLQARIYMEKERGYFTATMKVNHLNEGQFYNN
jgi:hypothetical protein